MKHLALDWKIMQNENTEKAKRLGVLITCLGKNIIDKITNIKEGRKKERI